jgi:DNA-binding FrmR family transcriptional regulator
MGIDMERTAVDAKPLLDRVNRVLGQLKGVARMIEENRDCPEILHTISAVHSALRGLEAKLLEDHLRHCVTDAASDPARLDQRLEEMIQLYRRRLS